MNTLAKHEFVYQLNQWKNDYPHSDNPYLSCIQQRFNNQELSIEELDNYFLYNDQVQKAFIRLYLDYLMIYKDVFFYTFLLLTHLGIFFSTSFLLILYHDNDDNAVNGFWITSWVYSCLVVSWSAYYKLAPHQFIVQFKQRQRIIMVWYALKFIHFLVFVFVVVQKGIQHQWEDIWSSIIGLEISFVFFFMVWVWWFLRLRCKARNCIFMQSIISFYE